jgi:hypothetical protein
MQQALVVKDTERMVDSLRMGNKDYCCQEKQRFTWDLLSVSRLFLQNQNKHTKYRK